MARALARSVFSLLSLSNAALARAACLCLLPALVASLAVSATAQQLIYVDAANPNCPGSGTSADPYCRIQDGIDAARNGDTILVADGRYAGSVCFCGKSLALRSERGPGHCTIDAQGSGSAFWFVAFETGVLVEGFTVTNGNSSMGGAIYCHHDASPIFANCVFSGNRAANGGALFCDTASAPLFIDCVFSNNSAQDGGAVFLAIDRGAIPTLLNCTITGNAAAGNGGGVYAQGVSSVFLLNCSVVDNSAVGNGAGIFVDRLAEARVVNSIVWGNRKDQISGPASVTFSDVQGGFAGTGNINLDPRFVDAPSHDIHLRATSPCRDAGAVVIELPPTDFEGDARIAFGGVDMGADEFFQHLYHTGQPTPGSTIQLKFIGLPQQASFWCLARSVMEPGLSVPGLNGLLRLDPQSLLVLPAGTVPMDGFIVRPVTIPVGFPSASVPSQALVGLQFTNLDPIEVR